VKAFLIELIMRRRSTILSLPGIVLLVLLLSGLGLTLWWQGGLAFSPGDLSAVNRQPIKLGSYNSHAEFERECHLCHQPLVSMQNELCVSCHIDVSDQIRTKADLHGILENVNRCAECHSDHRGRDFDPRLGSLENLDHALFGFSLIWHQVDYALSPLDCFGCHTDDDHFPVSIQSCAECHADHDVSFMSVHLRDFGDGCLDCHDGEDTMVRFDHADARFSLTGFHLEVGCADCHVDNQFEDLPSDCVNCHSEPAVHLGSFDQDCSTCHNSGTWKPAFLEGQDFDHLNQTEFSLEKHRADFAGSPLTCVGCHGSNVHEFATATCTFCHAQNDPGFIGLHQAQYGDKCLECHDGVDRMHEFTHADFFPLDGRHEEISCQDCHAGNLYKDTPDECAACHLEPQIHAGYFGLTCEYCHLTSDWYPAQLISHKFPIDHGGEGQVECQVCHNDTYDKYSCYGCHEHHMVEIADKHFEIGITSQNLPTCIDCHADGRVKESNLKDN
jgi:hypothetical protein